jgi:hypothetical protein
VDSVQAPKGKTQTRDQRQDLAAVPRAHGACISAPQACRRKKKKKTQQERNFEYWKDFIFLMKTLWFMEIGRFSQVPTPLGGSRATHEPWPQAFLSKSSGISQLNVREHWVKHTTVHSSNKQTNNNNKKNN